MSKIFEIHLPEMYAPSAVIAQALAPLGGIGVRELRNLAAGPWQPISEAPKDGTPVLVSSPSRRRPEVAQFSCDRDLSELTAVGFTQFALINPPVAVKPKAEGI